MKTLNNYMSEALIKKNTQLGNLDFLILKTNNKNPNGRELHIQKSNDEYKNKCFEWVSNHIIVNLDYTSGYDKFSRFYDETKMTVDYHIQSTNEFANNTYYIKNLYPEDKDLTSTWNYSKIYRKYLKNLKEEFDGQFGEIRFHKYHHIGGKGTLYFLPRTNNNFASTGGIGILWVWDNDLDHEIYIQENIVNNR